MQDEKEQDNQEQLTARFYIKNVFQLHSFPCFKAELVF